MLHLQKLSTSFYYLSFLFQLSVVNPENFKEIKAWEVLKFWKEKKKESHKCLSLS